MEKYIRVYFEMGLDYMEILALLAKHHHYIISYRHLKRILKKLRLFRRKHYTPLEDVVAFIKDNIKGSGRLHGYRWMFMKCRQAGLTIQKEYVRIIMQIINPEGVEMRRKGRLHRREYCSKGPNFIWHLDSYDKLKPFGICINGFSRLIIWLEAGQTSSDPRVISGYFVKAILRKGGPMVIRGDLGTENSKVAEMQSFLRRNDNDTYARNNSAFLYGTSQHNQRIESWWGIYRKENSQFWMTFFKDIKEDGLFSGDHLHKNLIRFCFLRLIQKELLEVVSIWNAHKIRKNNKQHGVYGRPYVLYSVPEVYGTSDYVTSPDIDEVEICLEQSTYCSLPCDEDIYDLANLYMEELGHSLPTDAFEAATLYRCLLERFETDLALQ
ncbi:Hypothetical predicted protein [Mytilus galloprovincialis]|uniref:Integrase core domain-containing protein n=1 Tax=Mytilus galloprovincialis TaxID=29158 RepID=A0A8B6CZS2_MYTGA|nr:Hypothetical predicted protein [Mytilus galloprovincialis]